MPPIYTDAARFWVVRAMEGCREDLKWSAGASFSSLQTLAGPLRDITKMGFTIVVCVVSVS